MAFLSCAYFLGLPLLAQTGRIVLPHFAADKANFESQITIENRSDRRQTFSIQHRRENGNFLSLQNISLAAGERQFLELPNVDGIEPSHALIDGSAGLFAGITYTPTMNRDNPIFIQGITQFSKRWRIYPSNWNESFDGLAIVNPSCLSTIVRVRLYDKKGNFIEEIQRGAPLEQSAKWVFSPENYFAYQPGIFLEIAGDQQLAVMSLKGNRDFQREDSILVGNLAVPFSHYEDMRIRLNENRDKWSRAGFGGNYQYQMSRICFCLPEYTQPVQIKVANFQFNTLDYLATGMPVELARITDFVTIEGLFDLIETAFDRNISDVYVTYHETLGYPTSVGFDLDSCLADEEYSFQITQVETLDPNN